MSYIMLDTPNTSQPQGLFPRRGGYRPSGTIIVHTSEGNWQAGVNSLTNLVRTRADYGCYHTACDWQDIAHYYPFEWETWQDSETNNWAVGIAAACRAADWGTMPADVESGYYRNLATMAAEFVTYMRNVYGVTVPLRRLTGDEARARVPGFCAHGDSGLHRSDPGPAFDWARFFAYTQEALGGNILVQGVTTNTEQTPAPDGETKMIVLATDGKNPQVWAGDGLIRRPVWSLDTMTAIQWLDKNDVLGPFYKDGAVQTIPDLNAIGIDLTALVGKNEKGL
jgi:hypothetical protein